MAQSNPYMMLPSSESVFPWSRSTSQSQQFSGLDANYRNQLMQTLMPAMQQSIQGLPGSINDYTNNALSQYSQMMNQSFKQNMNPLLGNLANRGVLSSTVASDAIGNMGRNIQDQYGQMGYNAAMQGAQMQYQLPSMLQGLMGLGQYSGSMGTSQSYQEDKTTLYRTLAGLMQGLM